MRTAQDVDILHQIKLMVNMKICLPCCLQNLFSPFAQLVLTLVEVIFHGLTGEFFVFEKNVLFKIILIYCFGNKMVKKCPYHI